MGRGRLPIFGLGNRLRRGALQRPATVICANALSALRSWEETAARQRLRAHLDTISEAETPRMEANLKVTFVRAASSSVGDGDDIVHPQVLRLRPNDIQQLYVPARTAGCFARR